MVINSQCLSVETSCDFVLKSVRNSYLNYNVQETPYSLYLTIRKSFADNKISPALDQTQNHLKSDIEDRKLLELERKIEKLEIMLKASEDSNLILKFKYEDALSDCEQSYGKIKILENKVVSVEQEKGEKDNKSEAARQTQEKDKIIKELKNDKTKLETELEDVEQNRKVLNKLVKSKEKENYDLRKENLKVLENLEEVKAKLANLTATVNREKKLEEKKTKKKERKDFLNNLKTTGSQELDLGCNKCDVRFETVIKLQNHERIVHMKSCSSQTEDKVMIDKKVQYDKLAGSSDKSVETAERVVLEDAFETYSCYYCDKKIASENHLKEHREKCRGSTRSFCTAPVGLSFRFSPGLPQHRHLSTFSLLGRWF